MNAFHLLRVPAAGTGPPAGAAVPPGLLEELAAALGRAFRVPCRVRAEPLDAGFAFDAARGQFHSTAILQRVGAPGGAEGCPLGGAPPDPYLPVLAVFF